MTIKFVFLFSRQGKLRLAKWFNSYPEKVFFWKINSCQEKFFNNNIIKFFSVQFELMVFLSGQEEADPRCDFSCSGARSRHIISLYFSTFIYCLYRAKDVLVHRVQGRPQDCLQTICQVLFLYANLNIVKVRDVWNQYSISCQVLHFYVWNDRCYDRTPFLAFSSAVLSSPETTNCSPWRSSTILLRCDKPVFTWTDIFIFPWGTISQLSLLHCWGQAWTNPQANL